MHWLLELDIFGDREQRLADAARRAGHRVSRWNDDWWDNGRFPVGTNAGVLFHGGLGNAARIKNELSWQPGAFCNANEFRWSQWAPALQQHLLNPTTIATTVRDAATAARDPLFETEVFVRPDSALKPFSGRVLRIDALAPDAMDFGFYYEDLDLPIILAPRKEVRSEFRFVVAQSKVIAGSAYQPDGRTPGATIFKDHHAWIFADELANKIVAPPDPAYVLDVCDTPEGWKLLELNPFSGADLYHCDPEAIVAQLSKLCEL